MVLECEGVSILDVLLSRGDACLPRLCTVVFVSLSISSSKSSSIL